MNLDVQTLLVALFANVCATAVALPLLMGWQVSRAARHFQLAAVLQCAAWALFLIAPRLHDRALTAFSLGLLAWSFALTWSALVAWLGPRPGRRVVWGMAALIPFVYAWLYPDYPARVGAANAMLALQMLFICIALAWPAPRCSLRWRALVLVSMVTLLVVTSWRGVLGAFFTDAYPFYRAMHPVNLTAAVANLVALMLVTLGMLAAWREEAERELRRQAQTDGLTHLPNRQSFLERAAFALAHAARYDEPLAVVMIDIDHFKQINDTHGHAAGDLALQNMARALRSCHRASDLVCRYGGEEFCVLLTRADVNDALHFDTRLRAALHAQAQGPALHYSAGVALRQAGDRTIDDILARADAALYQAKAEGRGRLVRSAGYDEQKELQLDA